MPRGRMTALAQQRRATGQHAGVVGTVWRMTQAAVFADRRVLPQIRTALLRVTVVAGIVQRLTGKLRRRRVAVRAVTTGTVHLPFEKRMGKCFQRFVTLQLMTIETHFSLGRRLQNGITWRVTDMAVGTGDLIIVVRTRMPAKADIGIVTAETYTVLCSNRCSVIGSERHDRRSFLTTPHSR